MLMMHRQHATEQQALRPERLTASPPIFYYRDCKQTAEFASVEVTCKIRPAAQAKRHHGFGVFWEFAI